MKGFAGDATQGLRFDTQTFEGDRCLAIDAVAVTRALDASQCAPDRIEFAAVDVRHARFDLVCTGALGRVVRVLQQRRARGLSLRHALQLRCAPAFHCGEFRLQLFEQNDPLIRGEVCIRGHRRIRERENGRQCDARPIRCLYGSGRTPSGIDGGPGRKSVLVSKESTYPSGCRLDDGTRIVRLPREDLCQVLGFRAVELKRTLVNVPRAPHSTVTLFARLRGLSTSVPRATAV